MKNKHYSTSIVCFIGVLIVGGVGFWSAKRNTHFWDLSITGCLTMLIAIVITFYYVQKNETIKEQKEVLHLVLTKIQEQVNMTCMYKIDRQIDSPSIMMQKRKLSNYIEILKSNSSGFGVDKDVEFIDDKFNEYSEFVGNHITNLDYLEQSENDLKRPLDLIDAKTYEIMFALYR